MTNVKRSDGILPNLVVPDTQPGVRPSESTSATDRITAARAAAEAAVSKAVEGHNIAARAIAAASNRATQLELKGIIEVQRPASLEIAFASVDAPTTTGQVRFLARNTAAWAARWAMMKGAEHNLRTGYFQLDRDIFGYAYLGMLLKKAREGKEVELMVDAMSDPMGREGFKSSLGAQDYLQELAGAGAGVKVFHPLTWRLAEFFSPKFVAGNHQKYLMADDKVAVTGGRNMSHDYFTESADNPMAWRDADVQVTGQAPTAALSEAFHKQYNNKRLTFTVPKDRLGNWRKRDIELLGSYLLMDEWMSAAPLAHADKVSLRSDPALRKTWAENLLKSALARLPSEGIDRAPNKRELKLLTGLAEELVHYTETRGASLQYAPAKHNHEAELKVVDKDTNLIKETDRIGKALITLWSGAQKQIIIENPYVTMSEEMIQALQRAGERGVQVILCTNSPRSSNSPASQAFFLDDWPNMLARVPNMRIFVSTGMRMLHAKASYIDDDIVVASTYNLDFVSAKVNCEVATIMRSAELVSEARRSFIHDSNELSNQVVEYKIQRDEDGKPILVDGKPVVEFGPESHLTPEELKTLGGPRKLANLARRLPLFSSLRHPPLDKSKA